VKHWIDDHCADQKNYPSTDLWACAVIGTIRSSYVTIDGAITYDESEAFIGTKDEASRLMCELDSVLFRYAQLVPSIFERCSFSRGLPTVKGF